MVTALIVLLCVLAQIALLGFTLALGARVGIELVMSKFNDRTLMAYTTSFAVEEVVRQVAVTLLRRRQAFRIARVARGGVAPTETKESTDPLIAELHGRRNSDG